MTPLNTTHAFNLASPYAAELADIDRRNRMAQVLQAQSQAPFERYSYQGIEAPISPLSGLAKALQGYTGMMMEKRGIDEQKALGEKYRGERSSDMNMLLESLKGSPGSAAQTFAAAPPDAGEVGESVSQFSTPAVAGRKAGKIDPSMIGQMKTPDAQNQALAMVMAQLAPKAPVILGEGQIAFNPETGQEEFRGGSKQSFGQPITEISSTGQLVRVAYDQGGNRKVIETAGSVPQDQWNSIPLAKQAELTFDQFKFGNFSATDLAKLKISHAELGNAVAKLIDEGIPGARGVPALPSTVATPPAIPLGVGGQAKPLNQIKPAAPFIQSFIPSAQPLAGVQATPSRTPPPVFGVQPDRRPGEAGSAYRARIAKIPEGENTLRDEYNKLTTDYRIVQDAHSKIKNVANTGAGDMSLLYSFVKLLDPGSVVRESEFATAAASGSFGERVQGAVQRVLTGQRMPDSLRNDFMREADNIYKAQQQGADRFKNQYIEIAKRQGYNPENVIIDYRAQEGTALPPITSLKEGAVTTFDNGQQWTLKNGKQVQVK